MQSTQSLGGRGVPVHRNQVSPLPGSFLTPLSAVFFHQLWDLWKQSFAASPANPDKSVPQPLIYQHEPQSRSQGFPSSEGHQPLAEARIMAWSISVSNWLLGQAPASSPFWELWEKKTNSELLQFSQEEWAGPVHALNPSIKQHSGAKSLSEVSIPHQALEE